MNKRFVTIVTHAENLELRKDPGQIPYQLHQIAGYDSTLVTYFYTLDKGRAAGPIPPPANDAGILAAYPFLTTEVPGLKMHFLTYKPRKRFYEQAVYEYLLKHSKEIDVLNLFHLSVDNVFYGILYKLKNPKGKIYLKLDIDLVYYRSREYFFNVNSSLKFLRIPLYHKIIFPLFFKLVHTISAEYNTGLEYFRNRFNVLPGKMMLLQNGIDEDKINSRVKHIKSFDEKDNVMITVGRIGSRQKNNEVLLEALTDINLSGWKVYFIGPIADSFNAVIDQFFDKHPGKRDQVFFTGQINQPETLYEYYNEAKIFCLTSIDEGFPLSAVEAAYFGNYLVLSDRIDCFNELTDGGKYGQKIPLNNTNEIAGSIGQLISATEILKKSSGDMHRYAKSNLTWQALIPKLHARLTTNEQAF